MTINKEINLVDDAKLAELRELFTESNDQFTKEQYIKALTEENTTLKEKLKYYKAVLALIHSYIPKNNVN